MTTRREIYTVDQAASYLDVSERTDLRASYLFTTYINNQCITNGDEHEF